MKIARSPGAITSLTALWRRRGESIGFVPTMGALHKAHLSLVRRARARHDRVVVSIFVNPLQFGPKEDLKKYPRPFLKDAALCREEKVDGLYHPTVSVMVPKNACTVVEVQGLDRRYCGTSRPGHFRGVATIVAKLLGQVRPDALYLGEKDYQQLVILDRMTRDLDLGVKVVGCPIIREADGLALSSRNAFLSTTQRAHAPGLIASLRKGALEAKRRGATPASVLASVRRSMKKIPGSKIDYIALADAATLEPARTLQGRLRLLAALFFRNTRLIDNIPILL
ncbi:MAG: pantoate--beta-alanine ligase [Elusimicrobia bacterium]|nr:MAG: pantoate--beta-alanine ligase [Elusimicrobiota bacterium]